jgi:large subunit ribosomal protein L22
MHTSFSCTICAMVCDSFNMVFFCSDEAFVGKGLYLKRLSYHAKGRSGIMVRPKCRLTVIVREITPEEEAKIAKLRVSNYKKLTRKERQLMPHQLIEVKPRWGHKNKAAASNA